jgi:phosphohistidine phosphatase
VEKLAAFLWQAGVGLPRVVHSGKARARQTAEILAGRSGSRIEARSGLDPKDPPQPIAREAEEWKDDVMLVGHLPFLGRLASRLMTESDDRDLVTFRPGSLLCLERSGEGGWTLIWMIRPELLPD